MASARPPSRFKDSQYPERAPLGCPRHERLLLLELAADLQNWPARNLVFKTALDRAAKDLVMMANGTDQAC